MRVEPSSLTSRVSGARSVGLYQGQPLSYTVEGRISYRMVPLPMAEPGL